MRIRDIVAMLAAFALTAGASNALAASITVPLDQAASVYLPAPAAGVIVGNPAIAGVSVQNDRLLFVTGRTYGATNLIVVGEGGKKIYETRVSVIADEGNIVMLTRGGTTVRHDCNPMCRQAPDLGDSPTEFDKVQKQEDDHASAATN